MNMFLFLVDRGTSPGIFAFVCEILQEDVEQKHLGKEIS